MRGWSQSELGKAIGVSHQQVQKFEQDKSRIAASQLIHVTQALRMRPEAL